jgi:hypothetical protein
VQTRTVLTSTPTDFVMNAQLDAYELDEDNGNPRGYSQNWQRSIPRQLV